jgi:hypothetical protein
MHYGMVSAISLVILMMIEPVLMAHRPVPAIRRNGHEHLWHEGQIDKRQDIKGSGVSPLRQPVPSQLWSPALFPYLSDSGLSHFEKGWNRMFELPVDSAGPADS